MLSESIKIGSKVELCIIEEDETAPKKFYKTNVENILSSTLLTVQTPHSVDKIFRVAIGQNLDLYHFMKEGIHLYRVAVESQFTDESIRMLNLTVLSPPKVTQRREFFRFQCSLDAKLENLTFDNQYRKQGDEEGTIKDIGAGGIRLLCNEEYNAGDRVSCKFTFMEESFRLVAIIIGRERLENGLKYRFRYRAKWDQLDRRTEDRLIKCIFEAQRATLKKEKNI